MRPTSLAIPSPRRWLAAVAATATLLLSGCGYNDFQSLDETVKAAWADVLNQYQRRACEFESGLTFAVDAVDALRVCYFPLAAGAANASELPDAPVVR